MHRNVSKSFKVLKNSALKKILVAIYPSTSRKRSVKNIPPSKLRFISELEKTDLVGNTTSASRDRRLHTDTSREDNDMLLMLRDKAVLLQSETKSHRSRTSIELTLGHFSLIKEIVHSKSASFSHHRVIINSKRRLKMMFGRIFTLFFTIQCKLKD